MNFLPQDFEYWWKVVRLYGWLLSGVVTALLVIVINESIAFIRFRKKKRGTLLLLLTELVSNESLLKVNLEEEQNRIKFKYEIWDKNCIDIANYISHKTLVEIDALYGVYRAYELGVFKIHRKEILSKTHKIIEEIAPLAGVILDK